MTNEAEKRARLLLAVASVAALASGVASNLRHDLPGNGIFQLAFAIALLVNLGYLPKSTRHGMLWLGVTAFICLAVFLALIALFARLR